MFEKIVDGDTEIVCYLYNHLKRGLPFTILVTIISDFRAAKCLADFLLRNSLESPKLP